MSTSSSSGPRSHRFPIAVLTTVIVGVSAGVAAAQPSPARPAELTRAPHRLSIRDLGTLGGESSFPTAMNERGQVVGTSETAAGEVHAFLWENGVMRDLGTLGGAMSQAYAINNRGQVTGMSRIASGAAHPFRWEHGRMTDLGFEGEGTEINDRGQIAGSLPPDPGGEYEDVTYRSFFWSRGVVRELGALEGGR